MAEVSFPTLHVPHTHARAMGQADGQVDRVCLLLTGSGLHVAGVPGRAAMLTVLTAHSLGGTGQPSTLPSSPWETQTPCPGQVGWWWWEWHSHEATGSRPSLHSGLGSRSVPRGSWCAGHSLYPCGEMGKPGGQASSPVHSPPCSPSDSARRPSTYSHGGSSAGGLSSRQPGGGWGGGGSGRTGWSGKLPCGTES